MHGEPHRVVGRSRARRRPGGTADLRDGRHELWQRGNRGADVINVALIGAGNWGKNLLRTLHQMRGAELSTCCDADLDRCKNRLNGFRGIAITGDPKEVFRDDSIQAVVIATPVPSHFELAHEAILAGKDVLVEKPMTLALDDAERLVAAAEERDRILMVGHLLEYHPCVVRMKELLESGELGKPYYMYSQRLNLGRIRKDENALWSFAPHDISIILHILDLEPETVSARGAAYVRSNVEDVVFLDMRFPDGVVAHVHVSWLDPHKVRRTTLVGSKKMVVFDDMEPAEKVRIYDKGVEPNGRFVGYAESLSLRFGEVVVPAIAMQEPLRLECEHFLECVRERQRPRSDGHDGLRVVRVLDAAQRSLKNNGTPIDLSG
ncbi:MAG: gfo/Idh/MocA family oxidoreductase [Candidatus Eisenbacteria bacterium]|nr:gfo/Idh/MocA family oxidoreductase [Candidatus Eisenbacteria bacterium]